jgi:hypothetical protein
VTDGMQGMARRKMPSTRRPIGGRTVDFDQRFRTRAKSGPFTAQERTRITPSGVDEPGFGSPQKVGQRRDREGPVVGVMPPYLLWARNDATDLDQKGTTSYAINAG